MHGARSLSLILLLALTAPAGAKDDGGPSPVLNPATGTSGISGALELVDGRVRGQMRAGAALRVVSSREHLEADLGAATAGRVDTTRYEFQGTVGVALFDMIEVGFHQAVVDFEQTVLGVEERAKTGLDDLRLAGKISLDLDLIAIAAYAKGQLPTGSATFADTAQLDLGAAGTVYLLGERIAAHVNVELVAIEGGTQAFRYRVGVTGIPLSGDGWAVRPFFYTEGIEWEGAVGADVFVTFGTHLLVGDYLFFELAGDMRIKESSVDGFADEGTSSLRVAMGATFDF